MKNKTSDNIIGFTEWIGNNFEYIFDGVWVVKEKLIHRNVYNQKLYTIDELIIIYENNYNKNEK